MDEIKLAAMRAQIFQRIAQYKSERIILLRLYVYANNFIEASAGVTDCRATCATEQIEQSHCIIPVNAAQKNKETITTKANTA